MITVDLEQSVEDFLLELGYEQRIRWVKWLKRLLWSSVSSIMVMGYDNFLADFIMNVPISTDRRFIATSLQLL